jgi:hypothetical protein
MSDKVSSSNLAQAVQDLMIDWQHTKSYWRDVKSRQFEQDYLDKLPELVTQARNIIGEIDALLRKVRTDCE